MANLSLHNICNPHYQRLQERFGEDLNPWPPPWYRRCSNDQLNYRTMLHYIPHSAWINFPVSISFRILYINQSATVCKGTIAVMLFKDLTPTSPRCLDLLVTALTFQSCSPFAERRPLRDSHFTYAFFASIEPRGRRTPLFTYAFGYAVAIKFNDIDKSAFQQLGSNQRYNG